MKKIISLALVLVLAIGFSLSIKAEETFKVKEIFPNQKFATEIAKKLGKNIDDEVSQEELDTITGATIVIGSANVDSIEGIGYLTNLKGFVLAGSNINEIPSEIGKLSKLAVLDINGSNITSIPNEISNLTNLVTLDLAQNEITSVTNDFNNLSKINEVNLSQNKISEYSSSFPTATIINLNNNKLSEFPKSILESTNLVDLNLSYNQLSSLDMKIDNLTNLKYLYVNNNKIVERVPNLALQYSDNIDKYSLQNHTQTQTLPSLYIYQDDKFTSEDLLPEIMKQVRENSNSNAQFKGTWYITKPSGGVKTQITANVAGNDFNSNHAVFSESGKYKVEFYTTNASQRYWGYSTYATEIIKVAAEKPTISVDDELTLYIDEEKALNDLVYNKDYDLKYSILDESILSFEDGLVKPLNPGQTTITLWVEDDYSKSKSIEVKVNVLAIPSFEIKDNLTTIDVKVGAKINLAEYLIGSDNLIYKASSSDSSIVSIEDSSLIKSSSAKQSLYIQANRVGQATITIEASNNDRNADSKTIIVNVSDSSDNDTIDVTNTNNEKDLPKSGSNFYLKEIISLVLVLSSVLLIIRKSDNIIK